MQRSAVLLTAEGGQAPHGRVLRWYCQDFNRMIVGLDSRICCYFIEGRLEIICGSYVRKWRGGMVQWGAAGDVGSDGADNIGSTVKRCSRDCRFRPFSVAKNRARNRRVNKDIPRKSIFVLRSRSAQVGQRVACRSQRYWIVRKSIRKKSIYLQLDLIVLLSGIFPEICYDICRREYGI